MQIGIVTDELSGDPATAFELGLEWGVSHFELRGINEHRVPRVSQFSRHELVRLVQALGVTITAISPGLFKIPLAEPKPRVSNLGWMTAQHFTNWSVLRSRIDDHLENLLPESIDFAHEIGAGAIIAFSFERGGATGEVPSTVVDCLNAAAEKTSESGLKLLVENEEGHWANSGAATAELLRRVDHAGIGVNWDPANARIDGDLPYPDGYEQISGMIGNVHFKDVKCFQDGNWEIVEDGDVDWAGQIAALARDGYRGTIALEPHLAPSVRSTRNALSRLRELITVAGD